MRQKAAEYRVLPDRIGIMGFSAGGHLASTAGTHFDTVNGNPADPIDRVSSRPDFLVLCYPVISFTTPYVHKGSMRALLGDGADPKLVESLSNELQVTAQTPPTFLFHTNADTAVPVRKQRSLLPGAAQGRGPGRVAYLRARSAWSGAGADRRGALLVARAPGGLAAQPRPAERVGTIATSRLQ